MTHRGEYRQAAGLVGWPPAVTEYAKDVSAIQRLPEFARA